MLQYNCDQSTNFVNIEPQRINFNNETFLKIEATLRMKQLYPITIDNPFTYDNGSISLYRHGVAHYQEELKRKNIY
jgi:hypothetical protein